MSEGRIDNGVGCGVAVGITLLALMFVFSVKIGRLRAEVADLQRRVAILEQHR